MNSPHTKGPWYFEAEQGKRHPRVYAADNSLVCEVGNAVLVRWEEWDPNACLISAAPDLLSALKSIARGLAPGSRTLDDLARDMMICCDIARAAIAKAEGHAE